MKKRMVIGLSIAALCGAAAFEIAAPPTPRLIYNASTSARAGWYVINPDVAVERGALVAVFAPDDARKLADERGYVASHIPLIKTVWATPGAEICARNSIIKTANRADIIALKTDRAGRKMPSWEGCVTLGDDEIFLVSTMTKTSFDSRYFGPVSTNNVLGSARFLGNFSLKFESSGKADGRARVERE